MIVNANPDFSLLVESFSQNRRSFMEGSPTERFYLTQRKKMYRNVTIAGSAMSVPLLISQVRSVKAVIT
jgi:hypothetical protein